MTGRIVAFVVGGLGLGVLTALLNREAVGQCGRFARWCVRRTAAGLPPEEVEGYVEEWTGVMDGQPGPLSELYHALSLLIRARSTQAAAWQASGQERPVPSSPSIRHRAEGWVAWAAGADRDVFARVGPVERRSFVAMGLSQLLVSTLSAVATGSVLVVVAAAPVWVVAGAALAWWVMVLQLDRFVGMSSAGPRAGRWLIGSAAVLFNVLLGLIVADTLLAGALSDDLGGGLRAVGDLSPWVVYPARILVMAAMAGPALIRLLRRPSEYDRILVHRREQQVAAMMREIDATRGSVRRRG